MVQQYAVHRIPVQTRRKRPFRITYWRARALALRQKSGAGALIILTEGLSIKA